MQIQARSNPFLYAILVVIVFDQKIEHQVSRLSSYNLTG